VLEVRVDEGQSVMPGDTLALLTAPTLDADLAVARARVAIAEAHLRDLQAGSRAQEVLAAEAELASARAEATRLVTDRNRMQALLDAGAIAQREFDAALTVGQVALERVRMAEERLSLLREGARPQQVAGARAEVASARAALGARRATTAEYVLLAPVAGTVLSRLADPGDLLTMGMPALVLGVMSEPWVRVYVPARVLPILAIGTEAEIYPPGAGGAAGANDDPASGTLTVTGRVIAINPQAEYVTRMALTEEERADLLFGVKVAIDDPERHFKPGMPVTVHLHLDDSPP
jgi:HlyD family secretion protein